MFESSASWTRREANTRGHDDNEGVLDILKTGRLVELTLSDVLVDHRHEDMTEGILDLDRARYRRIARSTWRSHDAHWLPRTGQLTKGGNAALAALRCQPPPVCTPFLYLLYLMLSESLHIVGFIDRQTVWDCLAHLNLFYARCYGTSCPVRSTKRIIRSY